VVIEASHAGQKRRGSGLRGLPPLHPLSLAAFALRLLDTLPPFAPSFRMYSLTCFGIRVAIGEWITLCQTRSASCRH
jgi:hypothetical protein